MVATHKTIHFNIRSKAGNSFKNAGTFHTSYHSKVEKHDEGNYRLITHQLVAICFKDHIITIVKLFEEFYLTVRKEKWIRNYQSILNNIKHDRTGHSTVLNCYCTT